MRYDLENDNLIQIIKQSNYNELSELCGDIREFIIDKVSQNGGHLASNLGVVELTVALHRVYDTASDRIIFDVGHQSYVHKIITGRAKAFEQLRKYGGLSGFPKSRESIHDAYDTGHSSTSISAAIGMAAARDLKKENHEIVAIIGDGSMTGGLAYEALNNLGTSKSNVKVILNDNGMSIARNVGGMPHHLNTLRISKNYLRAKDSIKTTLDTIPVVGPKVSDSISRTKDKIKYSLLDEQAALFEELGIKYIGPVDGYDIETLVAAMEAANAVDGPVLIHVITKKGKGYPYAEKFPRKFHGVGPFNRDNGKMLSSNTEKTFSEAFGESIVEQARKNDRIVAVCAAMGTATGLGPFYNEFEHRFFDVGIAEQHAVVFAAGLAKAGMIPVVAIYSSFLQRAYDQIIEDVCLQNLHVIFAIDRAGLVGADGETHHGQFDLSYLNSIPNLRVLCPADGHQLHEMMEYAVQYDGPIAIRYPRGSSVGNHLRLKPFNGRNTTISEGKDVTILAVGSMLDTAIEVADSLREHHYDVGVELINVVKPYEPLHEEFDTRFVVTLEDNTICGGFGSIFDTMNCNQPYHILNYALPDRFITHGGVSDLRAECGLLTDQIVKGVTEYIEGKA